LFISDPSNFGYQQITSANAGAAAASAASGLIASAGASPGGGDLLGIPLAQATTLDPPQWEPTPVATVAIPASFANAGSGGNLLGMPFAQATTLDPPQWEPAQATVAIPQNRLQAVDAVFAASNFAAQNQATGLDSGSLSNDDSDALFLPDGPDSWGVKLTELRTSLRIAPRSARPLTE